MGQGWQDCIVTLIDLVGIKKHAGTGEASRLMQEFHKLIMQEKVRLRSIAHAYAWNDSVLLLSYLDGRGAAFGAAMQDADTLKHRVDRLTRSYAIAVKGQTFPAVQRLNAIRNSGVTVVRASSWALANCFEIERILCSRLRKPWYVDGRIMERIRTSQGFQKETVSLLPSKRRRSVFVFDGYLWGPD